MWECYIIPSVLGMVLKLYSQRQNRDPVADLENGNLPYAKLLDMIKDGELSLISSPSIHELSPRKDHDPRQEWVKTYWTHRPHSTREILQTCLDVFENNYGAIKSTDWSSKILDNISQDLRGMRSQPVFMEKYRRYIVLDSPRVPHKTRPDALEWTTALSLDFKDDFFPTQ
ncbi:hypothetical protein H0H87_011007 [Tephrocybe sp. NHM501043]|nr:hypothetical protein H0H87_011007 [Tephrocybe sp. NHM501043]